MMNNFNLEDYKLMQDKKENNWLFIIVIFLLTLGILVALYKFDFSIYEKQNLIKENNKFLMVINSSKLPEIEQSKYIYINNKRYNFKIIEVVDEYTTINDIIYQTIYIDPYNYKTDAIVTECYFLKEKKTIYELIIEFIKGGKT